MKSGNHCAVDMYLCVCNKVKNMKIEKDYDSVSYMKMQEIE